MDGSIIIIAEQSGGQIASITYELFSAAEEISKYRPLKIKMVVLGADLDKPCQQIASFSGRSVVGIQNPHLATYNAEIYKNVLAGLLPELNPVFILLGQTTRGLDLAPALAVRLEAGCITGVEAVFEEAGEVCFTRSLYNGKIVQDVAPAAPVTIVTFQPGAFRAKETSSPADGPIEIRTSTVAPEKTKTLGIRKARQEDAGLAQAEVIVAAGRGIGKQENLDLIERLASLFPRSAVAGSRPLCDQNWLEYKKQVGLTGATVSPKLYLACGISGAVQHTVGMQGAGFIVAISTDPNAAIFHIADVCVVEDLMTFIPNLIREHEKA